MPDLAGWRDLGGGWSTNIAAGSAEAGELVIRIHQHFVDRDRLLAEQEARARLRAAGLPAVCALPIFDGSTVARLRRGNLVEAEPFVVADGQMDTPDRLIRGFALLGRVHDALRSASLPRAASTVTHANHLAGRLTRERSRAGVARIASWRIPELSLFAERYAAHITQVLEEEAPYQTRHTRQLVHGDYWDDNVLFANDEVAAILDFGFMAEHARIDDLALPIYFYLLSQPTPDPSPMTVIADMVDAYDDNTSLPLSKHERLALPLVVARQPAWMVGRWVLDEPDEARAQAHAREAAAEFPTAADVLTQLNAWQAALASRRI